MEASGRTFYIYCHTAPNGKRYIGQTCLSPEKRWSEGRGYVNCTYIHRAIEKYGWDNFSHDIICVVHSKKVADLFERHYIAKHNTFNSEYGYNLTRGGGGVLGCTWSDERKEARSESIRGDRNGMYGRHHTEESRRKMSEKLKGKHATPELREFRTNVLLEANRKRRVPVRQLDLDGNLVRVFPSIADVEESLGYDHSSIIGCCQGKSNTAYGFIWEYDDDDKRVAADKYRSQKPKLGVGVIQYDLDGNEVARFKSFTEAERATGLNRNVIGDCCRGGLDSYGGSRWALVDSSKRAADNSEVIQLDLDGNEVARYPSIADASIVTGFKRKPIRDCCRGRNNTSYGFIWKYADESLLKRKSGVPIGILQLDLNGNEIARFNSLSELERIGFNRHAISDCCRGKKDSYRNYIWQYEDAA